MKNIMLGGLAVAAVLVGSYLLRTQVERPFAETCEAKGGWVEKHNCKTGEHRVLRVSGKIEGMLNTEHCEPICILP